MKAGHLNWSPPRAPSAPSYIPRKAPTASMVHLEHETAPLAGS